MGMGLASESNLRISYLRECYRVVSNSKLLVGYSMCIMRMYDML
jgi:hypothetical protein